MFLSCDWNYWGDFDEDRVVAEGKLTYNFTAGGYLILFSRSGTSVSYLPALFVTLPI